MKLASIRKALAAPVLSLAAVITGWIASGRLDVGSLRLAVAGVVTGVVVYFVPNEAS